MNTLNKNEIENTKSKRSKIIGIAWNLPKLPAYNKRIFWVLSDLSLIEVLIKLEDLGAFVDGLYRNFDGYKLGIKDILK